MNKQLNELVNDIHKMSGIGKITLTEHIQALLTSEVEKERERLLKEVEEKVIDCKVGRFDENWIECSERLRAEQRKALSDIKEEGL